MEAGAAAAAGGAGGATDVGADVNEEEEEEESRDGVSPLNRRQQQRPPASPSSTPPRRARGPAPLSPARPSSQANQGQGQQLQLTHEASGASFSLPGPPPSLPQGQVSSFIRNNLYRAFGGGGAPAGAQQR